MLDTLDDTPPAGFVLHLSRATHEQALSHFKRRDPREYSRLDLSLLSCNVDMELADALFEFCKALPVGVALRLAHNDLGSGTECEQHMFDLKAEREMRESEKAYHEQKKRDSSKEKEFSVSAGMRRRAEEGINVAKERLAAIDEELAELENQKMDAPWYALFSRFQAQEQNVVQHFDLSNCGLHATGLELLTNAILDIENRADCENISHLVLDGNDLGDIGMTSLATLLRLSSDMEVLQLRNVGITEQGVSKIISGLVTNKSLKLLDLRSNGLCSLEVGKAIVTGVRRFNNMVEVLLG